MTGTVDIQELKRLAEAAKRRPLNAYREASIEAVNFHRAASPDTILALIEENERMKNFIRKTFYVSKSDGGIRYSWECDLDLCEVFVDDAITPIRTALEGVKK